MTKFVKYQGTGNDFVMIDNRNQDFEPSQHLIARLCHRRFGIGADGLILIQSSEDLNFEMIYFNADGREGSMCGNGGRCAVRFAQELGLLEDSTQFMAVDGLHKAVACEEEIFLGMSNVTDIEVQPDYYFMNTGSPHYVKFVDDLENFDVYTEGQAVRHNHVFGPNGGTNVNFVQVINENTIYVRTYERGVEDETYSCGTGVTAAAIATQLKFDMPEPINIVTNGGGLRVSFVKRSDTNFDNIYLIGPAVRVFEGTL